MSDGSLSQDEIDALLRGAEEMKPAGGVMPAPGAGGLADKEKQALESLLEATMVDSATILSTITGKDTKVWDAQIQVGPAEELRGAIGGGVLQVKADYTDGVIGDCVILFKTDDARAIAELMMGGQAVTELNDIAKSAVGEAVSQMLGAGATSIGAKLNLSLVKNGPPTVDALDDPLVIAVPSGDEAVLITYKLSIAERPDTTYHQLLSLKVAKDMATGILAKGQDMSFAPSAPAPGAAAAAAAPLAAEPAAAEPEEGAVSVQPVEFQPLEQAGAGAQALPGNIGLLMDVSMQLTVELGRTKKMVKEILGLGEGSIIELDKLAGEPVDLLVNDKLIARGEVVVIDENFGVRVTDIVSPMERLKSL